LRVNKYPPASRFPPNHAPNKSTRCLGWLSGSYRDREVSTIAVTDDLLSALLDAVRLALLDTCPPRRTS